jgi:hypothetical protein
MKPTLPLPEAAGFWVLSVIKGLEFPELGVSPQMNEGLQFTPATGPAAAKVRPVKPVE